MNAVTRYQAARRLHERGLLLDDDVSDRLVDVTLAIATAMCVEVETARKFSSSVPERCEEARSGAVVDPPVLTVASPPVPGRWSLPIVTRAAGSLRCTGGSTTADRPS